MILTMTLSLIFQSTLPHGSDRILKSLIHMHLIHFNPRSLTGATNLGALAISLTKNFNPRSLTGATSSFPQVSFYSVYFNPRSLTGATKLSENYVFSWNHFNPRSLTGATLSRL